jgi:hypothetical protein
MPALVAILVSIEKKVETFSLFCEITNCAWAGIADPGYSRTSPKTFV